LQYGLITLIVGLLAVSCGDSAASTPLPSSTPWPVTAFPALPEIARDAPAARIELGHPLFFDLILSVDHETACATCHSEIWAMSDCLERSIGLGAG
jgi:cytochrome c peroxidase